MAKNYGKRFKPHIDVVKGTTLAITLTFRTCAQFEKQLLSGLNYIKKSARAYDKLYIVPEMGQGKLHFHLAVKVKNVLMHKILMHNWQYKYGYADIDTWDTTTTTWMDYLAKESILPKLVPQKALNTYIPDILEGADQISSYMKDFRAEHYYLNECRLEEKTIVYEVRDITDALNIS